MALFEKSHERFKPVKYPWQSEKTYQHKLKVYEQLQSRPVLSHQEFTEMIQKHFVGREIEKNANQPNQGED